MALDLLLGVLNLAKVMLTLVYQSQEFTTLKERIIAKC